MAGQDAHFRYMVKSFLLWLNHARLEVSIAGMFTLDYEMLFGVGSGWGALVLKIDREIDQICLQMVSTIATFVVLLTQFHIAYSDTGGMANGQTNTTSPAGMNLECTVRVPFARSLE